MYEVSTLCFSVLLILTNFNPDVLNALVLNTGPITRKKPIIENSVAPAIEQAVIESAISNPALDQLR